MRRPDGAGSVGVAVANALAECQIGIFETELIPPEGPRRNIEHVETAMGVVEFRLCEEPEALGDLARLRCQIQVGGGERRSPSRPVPT